MPASLLLCFGVLIKENKSYLNTSTVILPHIIQMAMKGIRSFSGGMQQDSRKLHHTTQNGVTSLFPPS